MNINEMEDKILQLERENCKINELNQALKKEHSFTISKIAHEIRNPLTLINSSLQLIETQHPEVRFFPFWSQTLDDVQFLRDLLDDLTTFNNSTNLSLTPLETASFLHQIYNGHQPALKAKKINLSLSLEENLPNIIGDSIKLRQAVQNIIINASEALSEGGNILLHAFTKGDMLCITIADDGTGIEADKLSSIFDPFVTYKKNGTGLGLAISKNIIDNHNGNILVTSSLDKGTCFALNLPIF